MSDTSEPLFVGVSQAPSTHPVHVYTGASVKPASHRARPTALAAGGVPETAKRPESSPATPSPPQPAVAQPAVAQPAVAQPAVAQPAVAQPAAAQPVISAAPVVVWLEKVVASENRSTAIEKLGTALAQHFSPASIRIATGHLSLKRIYDHRLGWLSRESDLWRDAADHWKASAFDATWRSSREDETVIGFDASDQGGQRYLIWITGSGTDSAKLEALRYPLHVFTRLLGRLPRRSLPTWTVTLGAHWRMALASAAALLAILACLPVHYPVACTARVEPTRERLVTAPFDATLLKCAVRPGDSVTREQVLFELDGRPLRLERESIQAELDHAKKERDVALASRRIADAQQAELKQRQLNRQTQLLDDRLARLQVRSPIDGIVVSGDLERFVGSPLEMGQTLVEIAPLDRLSVEVEIPESEVGYVDEGSPARIRFAAAGGPSIRELIRHVSPAAELRDDRNVFVARIEIQNFDRDLRPGMRGEATTYGPRRPMFWRLGRSVWERLLWWSGY